MTPLRRLAPAALSLLLAGCAGRWALGEDAASALARPPRDLRVVRASGDTVVLRAARMRGDSIVSTAPGERSAVHRGEVRSVEVWSLARDRTAGAVLLVALGALAALGAFVFVSFQNF